MAKSFLHIKVLRLIKEKLDYAKSELVSESCSPEKGDITKKGNALFNADSALQDADSWLYALLQEIE